MGKILLTADVTAATGISRQTIWRLRKAGNFPQPVKRQGRHIGWRESDIERWIADRPTADSRTAA